MNLGDVQLKTQDSMVIARLTGEIDLSNAQGVGQAIARGITHEALGLVLDLTGLDFLDSAGVQLIYQLRRDLRARGQDLILAISDDSAPADTLRLAGISSQLRIRKTVEEALAVGAAGPE
jgi:anti-anti-sigma factor